MQSRCLTLALLCALVCVPGAEVLAGANPEDDQGYRAGVGLLNKGLNDLAAVELRKYLEKHPSGEQATNARYSLAVSLVRLGRHTEALKELDAVVGVDGFEFVPDALLLKAQCHFAAKEYEPAEGVLDRLVRRHVGFAQADRAAVMHGEALYRLGRFEDADKALDQVVATWPDSVVRDRGDLFAAMTKLARGNAKAAADRAAVLRARSPKGEYAANAALIEAQCRQRLRELPAAAALFETASGGSGAVRVQALLGLAAVSRAQGDLVQADRALVDASASEGSTEVQDRIALERGKLLFQQGNFKGAQGAFGEARKSASDAGKAEASFWFAKSQIRQGKVEEGIANLELAAERFQSSDLVPDMLFERAAAMSNGGDENALAAWTEWRTRFAGSDLMADALVAEAWCTHRLGRLDDCRVLIERLLAEHGGRERGESLALLEAENAFALSQFEDGRAAYTEFVQRYPKSPYAWRACVRRAMCLMKLGRGKEGGEAFEAAVAMGGNQDPLLRRAALAALADHAISEDAWKAGERWSERLAAEQGTDDEVREARLRQGICIARQRRFEEALPVFQKIIDEGTRSPQAVHARFELGQSLLELGRLEEARAAFEDVSRDMDGSGVFRPHALRHLASIATKQGRHKDAATTLAMVQDTTEGVAGGVAGLELGAALLAAGEYADAERVFSKCLESEEQSASALKAAVLRAIAINRQTRHEEALRELKKHADVPGLDPETAASGLYEQALALMSLGREPEAAETLRLVLTSGSPRLECYAGLELAQIHSKSERFGEALKALDRCGEGAAKLVASDRDVVGERATYLRGVCLLRLQRSKEAAEVLGSFESTYPRSQLLSSVRLVRGEALLASGQAREAAREFAFAAGSEGGSEAQATALLRLGEAWAASQEWVRSEEACSAFLDRHSHSELWFQAKFGQGWARENQGRLDAAIESYRDVVARHAGPTAARAQFQIGECLYGQKKYEQAVAELLKTDVLFEYPEWSAAALYEAGRCLAEMNRPNDASKQFAELIQRFPDTRWAKLAAERGRGEKAVPLPGRRSQDEPKVR